MRFLILSILALGILAAAEENPLPKDVQAALAKADKASADIQAKADADILKVKLALLPTLTKAQEAAMKKNDLTAAVAIKEKIDSINATVKPDEPVVLPGIDKIANKGCLGAANKDSPIEIKGNGFLIGADVGYDQASRQITYFAPIFSGGKGAAYGNGRKDMALSGEGQVIAIIGMPGKDGLLGGIQFVYAKDKKISLSKWCGTPAVEEQKQVLYNEGKPITSLKIGSGDRIDALRLP